MKFSEQWLREHINPKVGTEELVAQLTMAGLEIDAVEPVAPVFSGVVVGEILAIAPHPDAEKLRVCQVAGNGAEPVQVVCGAPNAALGLKIPFATLGAELPGDFKIKKAKLRGVESFGMLCGASEIGLEDVSEGLMVLPTDAPVGIDIRDYLNLDDRIIEVDLTPNRGDCLSIRGMAREVGVLNRQSLSEQVIAPVAATITDSVPVELLAGSHCPRYVSRVIRGVNIAMGSPAWLVEKLRRSGIRSIDPVVDVTNYILLELGQPMHAFDLAQVQGGIRVRMANADETLTLLDGQELKLKADSLVIADHQQALALAGIMGGKHSGVSASTQDILLEAAFFAPVNIAGRARSYGLHTDSSHRFERGVDYELPRQAMERATALLLEIVGGSPGPVVEAVDDAHLPGEKSIVLRRARINKVLGFDIQDAEVVDILSRLGMVVTALAEGWQVRVPSYRFDVAIEVDLLEELARVYGYNNLPVKPVASELHLTPKDETRVPLTDMRRLLAARGYQEAITYTFVDPVLQKLLDPEVAPVVLTNPISADMSVMRTNLWPGLLAAVSHNLKRQKTRVRLFESGLKFLPVAGGYHQPGCLAGVVMGGRGPENWADDQGDVDFYDLKGDVEALLDLAGNAGAYRFEKAEHPALHPGQTARIVLNGEEVGLIGALHPVVQRQLDMSRPCYVFELLLQPVSQGSLPGFTELSKFPEVRRDLAIIIGREVSALSVEAVIRAHAGEMLKSLVVFDVYAGKGIDPDRKSLAFGLTFQHPERTLGDDDVNMIIEAVVSGLERDCGATLRK